MRNAEASLQATIVQWLRASVPEAVTFANLNDGLYSKREASKRRWMGLLAGIPDVGIAYRGRAYFLEVKPPGRGLSEEQKTVFARLQGTGVGCAIVNPSTKPGQRSCDGAFKSRSG